MNLYKEMCPDLPLPASPIITRWGTWLEASLFYADHIEAIQKVVFALNDDARSIMQCKDLLKKPSCKEQLQYIKRHFKELPATIRYFETPNLSLIEAVTKLNDILSELKNIPDNFGVQLTRKIEAIFTKNPDFHILQQIVSKEENAIDTRYQPFIKYFDHPPVTSVDVERSFSLLNDLLTSKRTSLTHTNLRTLMLIYANSFLFNETNTGKVLT